MRKFKHTEDPWFGIDNASETGNKIIKNVNNVVICEILSPYKTDNSNINTEELANLRLIQYSPLILEKLCEIEELIENVISKKLSILDINVKEQLSSISSLLNKIEII